MAEKNISFDKNCTSHFGDSKGSYIEMRTQQILGIIRHEGVRDVAEHLFPNLTREPGEGKRDFEVKQQLLVEKAVSVLAGAEFTTHTQHALDRQTLVDALKKVSLRDTPKARRYLSDAQNPVVVPDFSGYAR